MATARIAGNLSGRPPAALARLRAAIRSPASPPPDIGLARATNKTDAQLGSSDYNPWISSREGRSSEDLRRDGRSRTDHPMKSRRSTAKRAVGLTPATALMLAIAALRPGLAAPAQDPAPAPIGRIPAEEGAGQARTYAARVIEGGTGRPVAGAAVLVRRLRFPDPETGGRRVLQETTHRTDAQGTYRFTIPPGQLAEPGFGIIVVVRHPDYPREMSFCYDLAHTLGAGATGADTSKIFDVELSRGEPVTGVVVAPDGRPAAGVAVRFSSYFAPEAKPGHLVVASVDDARTDELGRFRFVMITPGEGELSFYPERYAVSTHRLRGARRGDLGRFELREGIALKGRVLADDGAALAGIVVTMQGVVEPPAGVEGSTLPGATRLADLTRSAVTDARGEFAMAPLPPGSYSVGPVESNDDPLLGETFRRLPAPFAARRVTLQGGKRPEPLEIRALPHVVVEAHLRDGRGRPIIGRNFQLVGTLDSEGRRDLRLTPGGLPADTGEDDFWHGWSWPDATGKVVWHAPRGLEGAQVPLMNFLADERSALRYRIGRDGPLQSADDLPLGRLDRDVRDIEIVRFLSPTVLVRAVARDGSRVPGAVVTALYAEGPTPDPDSKTAGDGPRLDIQFAPQQDGRFRSARLLPDRRVTISARADGYRERSTTLELAEGVVRDVELTLDRR